MKREEPLIRIVKDKKRFLVKPPLPFLKLTPNYQQAFQQEARLAQAFRHPNLLPCLGMMAWEEETVICYHYEVALPLNKAVLEYSDKINSASYQIIQQLMEATIYLHAQGVLHADIHPGNIYITKKGCHVRLINSAQAYLGLTPSCLLIRGEYSAPERLEGNESPNQLTDLYAIGKVMEFIYSYSRVTLGIHRVISKATHPDPAKRYGSVQEMKEAFNQSTYWDWGVKGLKAAAFIGVMALCYNGLAGEKPTKEEITFFEDSKIAHRRSEASHDSLAQVSSYTNLIPATRTTETKVTNEEQIEMAERLFKSEFRRAALPVVKRIYTPQLMNGTEENFQQQSLDGFAELDNLQRKLAEDMGLSLRSATQLASEIIAELTQQSMNRLRKESPTATN